MHLCGLVSTELPPYATRTASPGEPPSSGLQHEKTHGARPSPAKPGQATPEQQPLSNRCKKCICCCKPLLTNIMKELGILGCLMESPKSGYFKAAWDFNGPSSVFRTRSLRFLPAGLGTDSAVSSTDRLGWGRAGAARSAVVSRKPPWCFGYP